MKNQSLQIFIVATGLTFSSLLAHSRAQTSALAYAQEGADLLQLPSSSYSSVTARTVTAAQYCKFLNSAAAESDPNHLYDAKMESDPEVACIARRGAPGRWYYTVIAGRENFPIGYVNEVDEEKYSLEQDLPTTQNQQATTSFLKSNLRGFAVDISSLPMLTLAAAASTSSSNVNSYIGDVGIVA
ncbi:MAG: hypothetical protein ACH346_04975, partial [Chthoniobacterales bacterium]